MHIAIISASVRDNSQSLRVANYLANRYTSFGIDNQIIDLNKNRLPLYNDEADGPWKPLWQEMSAQLSKCDGFIFISPEWDGMFSVGLHNMFHYVDREMADKPVLLVGVSSGRGGRYPLQQMRTMGYKNKHFVVIPENLFFDHIKEALAEDGQFTDERATTRTDYALKVLVAYAEALQGVRSSGVIDYHTFPNGL